ncbi:MAG: hypothetical protein A2017_11055 [Lentisphaerae bacterium GWF2_44_16]|nr:MAG: hypothetical protein A2017_11055 [Lentisphaerae bacterium GWF2_44_16]
MFRPVQNKKLHQQVFEQIQAMILKGRLKSGDRLPSERELGELLHVSRNSIREALRALEILGIIECHHGGGNYIKCDISSGILEPLSLIFRLHGGSLSDILEMRRLLEGEAAALAAERITPERAADLSRLIDTLRHCTDETESIRLDKEFHLKIAEYSGNVLLLSFLTAISSLLERSIQDGRQAIMRTFHDHDQLLTMHKNICKAVTAGNPKAATSAVNRHFKMIIDNLSE